jgi:ATP-dependent RNA helicase SUPV3L1/SUV3
LFITIITAMMVSNGLEPFRNIKRIVFTTVSKHDGKSFGYVSIPQLKQIAGRAGRFGTAYDEGEVTT